MVTGTQFMFHSAPSDVKNWEFFSNKNGSTNVIQADDCRADETIKFVC